MSYNVGMILLGVCIHGNVSLFVELFSVEAIFFFFFDVSCSHKRLCFITVMDAI